MSIVKKSETVSKPELHPRNKHNRGYDLQALANHTPDLQNFIYTNQFANLTIDYSNPQAVKSLNLSLLRFFYNLHYWDIPQGFLCPPIPSRADYIHYLADLIVSSNSGKMPRRGSVRALDIGCGANCIYPIIANSEYSWKFLASDTNEISILSAQKIIDENKLLQANITLKRQNNINDIFNGIVESDDYFDISMCNPPFHNSKKDAEAGNIRKNNNLHNREKATAAARNFGGHSNELWCEGGEIEFISKMILQSKNFFSNILWFSTLLSKETNLKPILKLLKQVKPEDVKVIQMAQGQKTSRIICWTFLTQKQIKLWAEMRWKPLR